MTQSSERVSTAEAELGLVPIKTIMIAVGTFSFLQAALQLSAPLFLMQIFDRVLTMQHGETLFVLTLIFTLAALTFGVLEIVKLKLVGRLGPLLIGMVERRLDRSALGRHPEEHIRTAATTLDHTIASGTLTALLDLLWVPFLLVVIALLEPVLAIALLFLQLGLGGMVLLRSDAPSVVTRDRPAAQMGTFRLLRFSGQILLLALAGWYALGGTFGAGALIAFSFLMMRSVVPFEQLMGARERLRPSIIACRTLSAFFKTAPARINTSTDDSADPLVLHDVYVRAPGGNGLSLANLSLSIAPGVILAVVGSSGSGKSLLCRVAAGDISPTSGSVSVSGLPVQDMPLSERRTRVQTHSWGAQALSHDDKQPAGQTALQRLEEELDEPAELYILDMPEIQLDQPAQMRVVSLLKEKARGGAAILLATGSRVFSDAADRVLVLQNGRLVREEANETIAPTLVSSSERNVR